jgi:hypothetical protein
MVGVDLDASEGFSLLMLGGPSVQMAPDESGRIVWMIIGRIKGHPTTHRMASQASTTEGGI